MKKKNVLIGLCGPAGCGKSTVADLIKPHDFVCLSFATPLKTLVAKILDCQTSYLDDQAFKGTVIEELQKTPREMMQTLGTEWGRKMIHPDIWLIPARRKVNEMWWFKYSVAFTDVRFENEAGMIRSMGGTVVHIERPGYAWDAKAHDSEAGVMRGPGDRVIPNVGELANLERTVRAVLGDLWAR